MRQKKIEKTIRKITDQMALELYRDTNMLDYARTKRLDNRLVELSERIMAALEPSGNSGRLEAESKVINTIGVVKLELEFETTAPFRDLLDKPSDDPDAVLGEENAPESQATEKELDADSVLDEEQAPTEEPSDCDQVGKAKPKDDATQTKRVAKLIDWMAREDISQVEAGKRSGVSGPTINMILSGKTQGKEETWLKIFTAISAKKAGPAKHVRGPLDKHDKSAGQSESTSNPNGKGPPEFLRMKLEDWIEDNGLTVGGAASVLRIPASAVRGALAGVIPHEDSLIKIGEHLPEVMANIDQLIEVGAAARKICHG